MSTASGWDGLTDTRFILPLETAITKPKPDNLFNTVVFKVLDIRQGRTVIPKNQEIMFHDCPVYGLRRIPGSMALGGGTQAEPPELRGLNWVVKTKLRVCRSRGDWNMKSIRQDRVLKRRKSHRNKTPEISRSSPLVFGRVFFSTGVWGISPKLGKEEFRWWCSRNESD